MSILIKGMEMPKSCRECGMEQEGFWCGVISAYSDTTCFDSERREECPLIEIPPHGRLIDADALMRDIQEHDYLVRDEYNSINKGMFTCGIRYAITEAAPTIIEAEEEKE